jgi:multiple sugar transport system permease protein
MTRQVWLSLRLVILVVFALFFVLPLVWLVLDPTKTESQLIGSGSFTFGSFHQVWLAWKGLSSFNDDAFKWWMINSLIYALGGTAIVIVTSVPAGYALALSSLPGRRVLLTLTLVAIAIPASALVLPIFLELNSVHLIGSRLSVILPFTFFPFGVYLAYIYYLTAIPPDLLDAARMDGCSELQTFRRVALPLARPVVAFVFFFSFVADWNNYFLPLAMLSDSSQYPVQLGLGELGGSSPQALAVILELIPVAVVFALAQRPLVRGLISGSMAG